MPAVETNGSGDDASTAPQNNPATTKTFPPSNKPTEEPQPQPPDILDPLLQSNPAEEPHLKGSIAQNVRFKKISSSQENLTEEHPIFFLGLDHPKPPEFSVDKETTSQESLQTNLSSAQLEEGNCDKARDSEKLILESDIIQRSESSQLKYIESQSSIFSPLNDKDSLSKKFELNKEGALDTSKTNYIESIKEESVESSESHRFRSSYLLHEDSSPEGSPESSPESSPEASPKKVPKSRSKKKIYRSMLLILRVTVATAISVILSALCSGSLQSETKSASPFFPPYSLVSDFYNGEVSDLIERLVSSDISLVVYYAPWDRDSEELRWEIEKVAKYHHEQVFIAAINCWQPGSQCRQTYKIRTYPAIVAHVRASSGLETKAVAYEGPRKAAHIINFLNRALKPFSHVSSAADLAKLQTQYDTTVLGYYDFSSSINPPGFGSFHLAALRTLGHTKGPSIGWGVVTNSKTAKSLSFNQSRSIHYVLWNTTLLYTAAATANSEAISNWILRRYDKTCKWLDFPIAKTLDLNNILNKGPILMLFTPDNPYYETNYPYSVLREVSLEYHNCEEKSRIQRMANILSSARTQSRNELRQTEKTCHEYIKERLKTWDTLKQQQSSQCYQSSSAGSLESRACSRSNRGNKWTPEESHSCSLPSYTSTRNSLIKHAQSFLSVFSDSCREMILQYTPWEQKDVCCDRNVTVNKISNHELIEDKLKENFDEFYNQDIIIDDHIEKMATALTLDQCKRLFHGSMIAPNALLKERTSEESIMGLGCKTNNTLSFVAIDSMRHKDVAQRIGLNLTAKQPHKTAAVIVDSKEEVHFILDASVNKKTLVNFILNYTSRELDRAIVSRSDVAPASCPIGQVCLVELNSNNYYNVTHQEGQVVMVLHYSRVCGACSTVGHALLTLAHHVQHISSITIARVDVSQNTLPWQFNFGSLPAIVVFPQHNKGNSHMFDIKHEVTVSNLMSFLVANLSFRQRLKLALSSCDAPCAQKALYLSRQRTSHLHRLITTATARLQQILTVLSRNSDIQDQLMLDTKYHLDKSIQSLRNHLRHMARIRQYLRKSIENGGREMLNQGTFETLLKDEMFKYVRKNQGIRESTDT